MKKINKIRIGNDIRLAVDLRQYIGHDLEQRYICVDDNFVKNKHDVYYGIDNRKHPCDINLKESDVYCPKSCEFESIDKNRYVNKSYELYYPCSDSNDLYIKKFYPNGTPVAIRSVKAIFINVSKEKEIHDDLKKKTRFISRFPIEPCLSSFDATPYNICNSGYPTWRAYPHTYWPMPYHGFGVHPQWDGIYKKLPIINNTEYIAPVSATKYQNVVEVHFPATEQRYTGMYKLVIVAKLYCPGYNPSNLKTITIDVPDVFELVGTSEEGIDTGISINTTRIHDIYPGEELCHCYDDDASTFECMCEDVWHCNEDKI